MTAASVESVVDHTEDDQARLLDQGQHTLDTTASTITTEATNQPDSDSAKVLNARHT